MSTVPKKYRFTNPMPSVEPRPLPARRPDAPPVEPYYEQQPPVQQYAQPQVVNVYQAPPDRTVQRLALGAGMGAGAVAAAVYFGPMLTAALTFMTIWLGILALVVAVIAVSVVMVVRSVKAEPATRKRRR